MSSTPRASRFLTGLTRQMTSPSGTQQSLSAPQVVFSCWSRSLSATLTTLHLRTAFDFETITDKGFDALGKAMKKPEVRRWRKFGREKIAQIGAQLAKEKKAAAAHALKQREAAAAHALNLREQEAAEKRRIGRVHC